MQNVLILRKSIERVRKNWNFCFLPQMFNVNLEDKRRYHHFSNSICSKLHTWLPRWYNLRNTHAFGEIIYRNFPCTLLIKGIKYIYFIILRSSFGGKTKTFWIFFLDQRHFLESNIFKWIFIVVFKWTFFSILQEN